MRIVALLQVYNERRFIACCLEHLEQHGIFTYLIDNESSDDTVAIAERYLRRNLLGIETLPRAGHFSLQAQMIRKEQLAESLDADWFIHLDADELRVTNEPRLSLARAVGQADEAGFNAIDFLEFNFVPTRESPDHDHPDFARTMRSYYLFSPRVPHHLTAWKRQDGPVELHSSGGHRVHFPGLKMAPQSLYSRHYFFLSLAHLQAKYTQRQFAPEELAKGWHQLRRRVDPATLELPSERDLHVYVADHLLDTSQPRRHHVIDPQAFNRAHAQQPARLLRRALRRSRRRARALRSAMQARRARASR